jgi:hypothetical protein
VVAFELGLERCAGVLQVKRMGTDKARELGEQQVIVWLARTAKCLGIYTKTSGPAHFLATYTLPLTPPLVFIQQKEGRKLGWSHLTFFLHF